MAKRPGRAPKPAAVHRLQGTFQPVRHAQREMLEPSPVGELPPVPPDWMSPRAKRIWISTLPFMMKGTIGTGDVEVMAGFCEQAAIHQQAVEAQTALDENKPLPFLTKGADGRAIASPYLRIARQALSQMAALASELGLSPTARARIGAIRFAPDAASNEEANDPWDAFTVIQGGRRSRE